MSSSKKIMTLLMECILIVGCSTMTNVPEAYHFTLKEVKTTPYGCWTILQANSEQNIIASQEIAGELVCMDADTLYLLVHDGMVQPVYSGSVTKAELYTHKNMSGTYFGITLLYLAPALIGAVVHSEFGLDFLAMGIPMAVIGLTQTASEGSSKNNRLIYPEKDTFESFTHFARFPAGKPVNIDFKQLELKK